MVRVKIARRRRERGATLILVLLVLTLLVTIGVFTARSTQLATVSSGYVRHQTQARYVGEYGLMLATTLLGGDGGQSYLNAIGTPLPQNQCAGQSGMTLPTCYKLYYKDVQTMVGGQGFKLCEAATTTYPGSLGMANAECDFAVELTDKVQGTTPSGFDTAGSTAKPLKFFYVTATVTAQVRLLSATAGALDATSAESSSTQTLRSRILAGPYPAK